MNEMGHLSYLPLLLLLFNGVTADMDSTDSLLVSSAPMAALIAAVCIISIAVICWTGIFLCTDCYNAEVDSHDHPACRSTSERTFYPLPPASQQASVSSSQQFITTYPPLQDQQLQQHLMQQSQQQQSQQPTDSQSSYFAEPSAPDVRPVTKMYYSQQSYGAMGAYD